MIGIVRRRESDHGILFVRLVAITAEQAGVLVGLEVRHAHYHRMRRECRRNGRNPLYHPPYEEITRRLVCRNEVTDLAAQRLVEQVPSSNAFG